MNPSAGSLTRDSPRGMTAMGIFLIFGTVMATLAGVTMVWRGTFLDRVWAFNALAYQRLAPYGRTIGIPFLLLGVTMAVAAHGWFRRRLWGRRLSVAIIATQVVGDLANPFVSDVVRGAMGFVIAGALLIYLLSGKVRAAFMSGAETLN
jgi:hypothetical protein